jgi:phosphoenolpyruvate synthase/pyruvate phosphate dikinase
MSVNVIGFDRLRIDQIEQVGGKNASLGEMIGTLKGAGIRVPDGFATTSAAYRRYLAENDLEEKLRERLEAYRKGDVSLHETGESIRRLPGGRRDRFDLPQPRQRDRGDPAGGAGGA